MSAPRPRIVIPVPTSHNTEYNERSWSQYARAVEAAGGEPLRMELGSAPADQARLLASASGVLLPGSPADVNPERYGREAEPECSPADPAREAADELLLQDAFNLHKPLLGICYGMQSMNVWSGGTLVQHLRTEVDHRPGREVAKAHPVRIERTSRLGELSAGEGEPVWTNSSHHQAVEEVGDRLRIVGISGGDGVIEAVEGTGVSFVLGVQWHPERTTEESPLSARIFQEFVAAASRWTPPFPEMGSDG